MHALCHALVLAHQPHDNTYGLAATPDGQTVFVDSRSKSAYPLKVEVSTSAV